MASNHYSYRAEVKRNYESGKALLESAVDVLGIYGGMSHSIERDEAGDQSIGFDLATAPGETLTEQVASVIKWLEAEGDREYTFTIQKMDWNL